MTVLHAGSLFTGTGMLDVAVHDVTGAEPAWFVENDPAASRVLAHHWPDVPNLGDVSTVDWASVEPVDILTAGFPCQDISSAGRRAGMLTGTRSGLWSHMVRAIAELQPGMVVLENVRGLTSTPIPSDLEPCTWCVGDGSGVFLRSLGYLLGNLADIGFDAQWCGLRASDVGIPHGRYRIFIVAWPAAHPPRLGSVRVGGTRAGWSGPADCGEPDAHSASQGRGQSDHVHGDSGVAAQHAGQAEPRRRGRVAPDAVSAGREPGLGLHGRTGSAVVGNGASAVADRDTRVADLIGRSDLDECGTGVIDWGVYGTAVRRWELILGRPAPSPTRTGARGGQRLSPLLTEWMMGWPRGWVTAVPELTPDDQVKLCGNGVVPHQATAALRHMLTALSGTAEPGSGNDAGRPMGIMNP